MEKRHSNLMRPRHPMPDWVRQALIDHKVMEAYRNRPPYQQNDYIGWIMAARREETRQRRLNRMLDELLIGDLYMGMTWKPLRRDEAGD